jgi:LuxR family transcriptional regulator, maltose regulon positive regulatory protein
MATHAARQVVTGSRRSAAFVGDPILAAKVTAPDVPDWALPRPRITKLVARGARWCPLTVVTGPVGAGKTMALALWAASESMPVAWLCLDEYDNRPGMFWSYAVAALRRSGAAVPDALSATTRGCAAEHVFLPRLASVLAAQDPPVALVVDDFGLLTEPRVLNGLDFLLRNAGTGLRLVLSSRMDPPFLLHRYRLAGTLAEIRAGDLAFTVAEAGQLLAQHGCKLSAGSLECLTRRTEGWAAALRLAAMSMAAHPDPEQFVMELLTEERGLSGYLVAEVLDTQPPEVREVLLSTSILEHVNAGIASELAGNRQAGRVLAALAHANAFIQPIGGGWYRYHTLFAEVMRLQLKLECPHRTASLHRQAARWYQRNGQLTDAVRHAVQADDWPLAASMVIDELAIGEILEPMGSTALAHEFASMPGGRAWPEPQPDLVSAALAVSAGRPESAATALDASERIFERVPAEQEDAARLAAAMIRLAVSRCTGDFAATTRAVAHAEALISRIPAGKLARRPGIRARVLSARGAAGLWSGRFGEAARVLDTGVIAAAASGDDRERIDCLGHLALVEVLRGRLGHAAKLARQATAAHAGDRQRPQGQHPNPAALAALAWVHLEHHELGEARGRLKQVETALGMSPDRLIGAVAYLVAACDALAEGHADVAVKYVARTRSGGARPAWLEQKLDLAESQALAAVGDIEAAVTAAKQADCGSSPEAAVTLAHAWAAAGAGDNARRAIAPLLAAHEGVPERVRLQACLVDARLSYRDGDQARGRRSLGCALRLAEREQLRLPFALERDWIAPVLRHDPELADAHQRLLTPAGLCARLPTRAGTPDESAIPVTERVSERELQVLRGLSRMLTTAEIASEMYISTNTVKTHVKNICHKLAATRRGDAVRRARQLQLI